MEDIYSKDSLKKVIVEGTKNWTDKNRDVFTVTLDFDGFHCTDILTRQVEKAHNILVRFGCTDFNCEGNCNDITGHTTNSLWKNRKSKEQFINEMTEVSYKYFESYVNEIQSKLEPPWTMIKWTHEDCCLFSVEKDGYVYISNSITGNELASILKFVKKGIKAISRYFHSDIIELAYKDHYEYRSLSKYRRLTDSEIKRFKEECEW